MTKQCKDKGVNSIIDRIIIMENEDNLTRLARVPKVYGEFNKLYRKVVRNIIEKILPEMKEEPNL